MGLTAQSIIRAVGAAKHAHPVAQREAMLGPIHNQEMTVPPDLMVIRKTKPLGALPVDQERLKLCLECEHGNSSGMADEMLNPPCDILLINGRPGKLCAYARLRDSGEPHPDDRCPWSSLNTQYCS